MKPETFIRVANSSELNGAGPFALSANGADVVLLRTGGGWRAFEGRCPHQGALLGEGEMDGGALVCRNHRWRFSVDSGRREGGPECLASCPVAERDGGVFVDVTGLKRSSAAKPATRSLDDLPGPKGLPVIGNLHQIDSTKVHLILEGWAARYGSTFHFWMGSTRVVATSDPALIEEALRARPETFRRSAKTDLIMTEIGIRGVFNAEGEVWRPQRKLSVAALAQRNLRQLYPSIRMVAERLKTRWHRAATRGETLDIVEELKRFTVDVTMLIAFGHDANTVGQADDVIQRELEVILPAISRRNFALFPTWRYVQTPSDRRLVRAFAKVRAWLEGLLTDARARLEAEPERGQKPSNFIEAMLIALDEDGKPFSDDVILSNLVTMLLAGEDTTAFTLAWAIHLLCDSPQWASELRREADAVVGPMDAPADLDTANRLARASAVANETMRLRPVAPIAGAEANVDTALGDFFVPKGTRIALLLRPAATDPVNFVDPLVFRPERWLEHAGGAHNGSALLPFGSGPRMCPGRSLALLEMKTLLAMLTKTFDLERVGTSADVSELFGFTMSPANLRVRLNARA
ncbi:MAG: cytochrome P450 [Hyphomicrobiales bacterium]|nr:cytochrome P450 [Hyphomicrobiales bacterium]MBV8439350.1 cytochrome P450 [Hyphomicrobiales bacterium]